MDSSESVEFVHPDLKTRHAGYLMVAQAARRRASTCCRPQEKGDGKPPGIQSRSFPSCSKSVCQMRAHALSYAQTSASRNGSKTCRPPRTSGRLSVRTVLHRQVRPHCLYLDLAVVGALALWVHQPFGLDVEAVRNRLSPERSYSFDWRQMRRWAAGAHRLPHLERPAPRGPPDEAAADLVGQIAALGPERREWPVWKRAVWQLSEGHHAG